MTNWWNENVSDHKKYGEGINFLGKQFMAWYIPDGSSVLDAGCGNGLVYKAIKESGKKLNYKGIDYSEKMIKAAKEMYPEATWAVSDIRKINEPDKSYDYVLLFHVLECLDSYEEPIKEALRIAKKKVAIVFWKGLQMRDVDLVTPMPPNHYASIFSASKFFSFIRSQGFAHQKWVELFADGWRYNLFVILDLETRETETSHL